MPLLTTQKVGPLDVHVSSLQAGPTVIVSVGDAWSTIQLTPDEATAFAADLLAAVDNAATLVARDV